MAPISNATRLADFGSGIGTEGAVLKIDNDNKRVGIGSTVPASLLQVGLGITIDGTGINVAGVATFTSNIDAANLPTSNPGVAGRIWRSGNDLKISTG